LKALVVVKRIVVAMTVLGLAVGAGGAVAYQWITVSWFSRPDQNATHAASVDAATLDQESFADSEPREVSALGHLEPAGGVVNISSPALGERIVDVLIEEGENVLADEELVRLDDTFLTLQLDLAREAQFETERRLAAERSLAAARLNAAKLAKQQVHEGTVTERQSLQTQREAAAQNLAQAKLDLERIRKLVQREEPLASAQQLEHQRLLVGKAEAELAAADAALVRIDQTTRFRQQTADAELEVANAGLEVVEQSDPQGSLAKQVDIAEKRMSQTSIRAPQNGVVLKVFVHEGEHIAQQPLLQLAKLDEMACVAEVFDGDIKHVSVGQKVQMRSRAFTGDYRTTFVTGTVGRIGNMVKTPDLKRLDGYPPVDRHVIEVRIRLDDVAQATRLVNESATALVNLQVEVNFLVEKKNEKPEK